MALHLKCTANTDFDPCSNTNLDVTQPHSIPSCQGSDECWTGRATRLGRRSAKGRRSPIISIIAHSKETLDQSIQALLAPCRSGLGSGQFKGCRWEQGRRQEVSHLRPRAYGDVRTILFSRKAAEAVVGTWIHVICWNRTGIMNGIAADSERMRAFGLAAFPEERTDGCGG